MSAVPRIRTLICYHLCCTASRFCAVLLILYVQVPVGGRNHLYLAHTSSCSHFVPRSIVYTFYLHLLSQYCLLCTRFRTLILYLTPQCSRFPHARSCDVLFVVYSSLSFSHNLNVTLICAWHNLPKLLPSHSACSLSANPLLLHFFHCL